MANPREQRFSTAIILATLALCAFFLAQGTTRVLAAELLDKEEAKDGPRVGARIATNPEFLRRRDPAVILKRNIFDSSRGDLTLEPVAEAIPGAPPAGEWDPSRPAPRCTGTLRLVGSVVSPNDPEWSFAAIAGNQGKTMLYRKGSNVDGSYVLSVRASSVVVQAAGAGACELSMFAEEEAVAKPLPATAERVSTILNDRNAGLSDEELDQGIEKISDTKFNIQRSVVDKVLANQGSIMKTARVIPHEEDGRVVGVKLYGIRRMSLLGKLGIRNGDMLRTINGFDMTSPDTALEAYSRLRTADALSLAVKRQNKEMTIEYNIQ
ncbi:MAG: general secretion pathway protein GspC [Myxococcales bacterium]|nr:general secretion pathway protein GspC [Myxococcales bacterium]MDH3485502.1 general secretion pathway protein GspC [Myxococcales bacterium]